MPDMTHVDRRPVHILVAADNEVEAELTRLSFRRVKQPHVLHIVEDGVECLEFLRQQGRYAHAPAADLVLLDTRLPRLSGAEVMRNIAEDQRLCHLPVVALTPFGSESEVLRMYQLRCSVCLVKPVDFCEYEKRVQTLMEFWFELAHLPQQ